MAFNHFIIFVFVLFLNFSIVIPFYVSKDDEIKNRLLTENTLTKISGDLYMVNYKNDYYLEDLLKTGGKDLASLYSYAYSRFGNMYDFATENSFTHFACSAFNVLNPENQNLFGRNFDFSYSPSFIVWTQPKKGYKSVSFVLGGLLGMNTEIDIDKDKLLLFPYTPLDGLNEHGLGMSVLVAGDGNNHQHNPYKLDLTTSVMIRGVLDTCKTTQEAIDLFKKYNMHDALSNFAFHFFITDNEGNSAIIEYLGEEMKVYKNNEFNYTKYLYLTNFYISKPVGEGNNGGLDRFEILKAKLKNDELTMNWEEAMTLLYNVSQSITVWSNVYNTKDLNLVNAYKLDYKHLYKFNVLQPMNYTEIAGNL